MISRFVDGSGARSKKVPKDSVMDGSVEEGSERGNGYA